MKRYVVFWSRAGRVGSLPLDQLPAARLGLCLSLIQRDDSGTEHYYILGMVKS